MLDSVKFQYFSANIYNPVPLGFVDLKTFIRANKEPRENIKTVFKQIEEAERVGDMKLKAKLKQENLVYFTPCCVFDGSRSYENIVSFCGMIVLDYDHIDNVEEFKQFLFNSCSFIIACWKSPSGRGVKCLVKIPIVQTVDEFKEYFFGLAYHLCKYRGWDGVGQNPSLPTFIGWDEKLLYRDNPTTWTQKGKKINEFDYKSEVEISFEGERSEYEKNTVKKKIRSMIESIEDNGHKVVVSSSLLLGGFVASSYLDLEEAESFIHKIIENAPYTSQKYKTYQKTSSTFLREGMKRPLELDM